jgi:glucokinase
MIEPASQIDSSSQKHSEERCDSSRENWAIGIDVGGTKIAAAVVHLPEGTILARRLQPTAPSRGGAAVLDDVIELSLSLIEEAKTLGAWPNSIGIGVCELVNPNDEILSEATIHWKGQPIAGRLRDKTQLPVSVDADVRVAARGEAHLGAGRGLSSFLYVTVGTGISACFVLNGEPYAGPRGLTGTFASSAGLIPTLDGRLISGQPLEQFAAGPAISQRFAALQRDFNGSAPDVLELAEQGNLLARTIVETAGQALGAAIAQLANVLDPQGIILGGGLGLATGLYRESLEQAFKQHVWAEPHRGLPIFSAHLQTDAGVIGAALGAAALQTN